LPPTSKGSLLDDSTGAGHRRRNGDWHQNLREQILHTHALEVDWILSKVEWQQKKHLTFLEITTSPPPAQIEERV